MLIYAGICNNISWINKQIQRGGGKVVIIGICDDETLFRDGLKDLCEHYTSTIPSTEVVCFSSGEQVLAYNCPIDILFLDIYMKGINGMQVARRIHRFFKGCYKRTN
jgi:DNA-binding NarL/FixJ family response regulator